ncbi:MAG: class I tRNA ligase family protein, partial [Eudoraea sp.]|nr:class I tRNA ligase family protein [Eudoraea sp.]
QVDLYIGGIEHATGHLLYSRFWQKFMFDKGLVPHEEYAKKLINQGMILGTSAVIYRVNGEDTYVSKGLISNYDVDELRVDVSLINSSGELDLEGLKSWQPQYREAEFILEEGKYFVGREIEKMSKSKYNVVNPDAICEEYGADALRMYEMFLGPLEQAKPWNTAGITGVYSFLKKLWRLYHSGENGGFKVDEDVPSKAAFKQLHQTIKKVEEDIEAFSFNTSVATFMICVNELTALKCSARTILEPLAIIISPYAPHIAEELWARLGHKQSIATAPFPEFDAKYLVEDSKEYPKSFNGKMRFTMELPLDLSKEEIETAVMANEKTQQQLQGRTPKKVIVVPGKIVNIVG